MAEVKWQARRVSDGVLVDVTGDTTGTPASAPTANELETGSGVVTIYRTTVTLTDAQIKALPTTKVEIIPAQTGKIIRLVSGFGVVTSTAGGYTNVTASTVAGSASLSLTYASGDNMLASNPTRLAGLINAAGVQGWLINPYMDPVLFSPADYIGDPSPGSITNSILSQGIFLQAYNTAGNFTGGNAANSLTVTVWHGIVDVS